MPLIDTAFSRHVGIDIPLICGAMYPCSNPELVAAASEAGGIGIIQPMSLTFAHGYSLRDGIRHIKSLTQKPLGFNAIVEKTVKSYEKRMQAWIDIALEEGIRLFITALGNPSWVVQKANQAGALVYHDVTSRLWAQKARDAGVHGLICVNADAGGHAGQFSSQALLDELQDLGLPLICAGGIGDGKRFAETLQQGYAGVQMGTRFIATEECQVHHDYKAAILKANAADIVHTDKISGVPCAVIKTPYIEKMGTKAGPVARWLLKGRRSKKVMRSLYSLSSIWKLKRASLEGISYKDYFAAGRSVASIQKIVPVAAIYQEALTAHKAAQELKSTTG